MPNASMRDRRFIPWLVAAVACLAVLVLLVHPGDVSGVEADARTAWILKEGYGIYSEVFPIVTQPSAPAASVTVCASVKADTCHNSGASRVDRKNSPSTNRI